MNPDHMEVVTRAENLRRGKGTKLTLAQVQEIRRRYIPGTGFVNRGNSKELAKEYKINRAHLMSIINRTWWK
jgi:hypothetical protein